MHNWLRLLGDVVVNRQGRTPRRPGWCTYLVTYRCNARCKMCDSWRIKPGSELTVDQVRTVFSKVGRLDIVRLTGGEPFVREDFPDLVRAVHESSRPAVIHITSNGSFPEMIERFVQEFPAADRLRFMISFDGMPAEHDASRGQDVTFAQAEETVLRLARLRSRFGIEVSVNHTVINPTSLADHQGLVDRFSAHDVDVQAVLAYSDSAMYGLKRQKSKATDLIPDAGYPLHPLLQEADCEGFVRDLLARVPNIKDRTVRLGKRYYLKGLLARLRGERSPQPHPKCVALRSHLRILPDGSVPVCQFNTERVGNLLTQSFEEVWFGSAAMESRDWVDRCSGCWAECEVMPSALYTGDLLVKSLMPVG